MTLTVGSNQVERTAHSYAGSPYLLPSDEEEAQRLLTQHRVYTRLLSGRLVLPPVKLSDKDEVLDIGTGSGAWLCDVRTKLPEMVQLYGVDIESRLFPAHSANVHLSVCSATNLPSSWASKFSLVHQRLMVLAYTRDLWRRSIAEMYRVLAPGGYVQLIEIGPEWASGPKTAAGVLFMDDFLGEKDMLWRCSVCITDMLKVTGFINVTSEQVCMNLGKWAGENGIEARDATIGAFKGIRDSVMRAGGFGQFGSGDEFEKAMDEVAEEWDNMEGSHTTVRICCGQKPL